MSVPASGSWPPAALSVTQATYESALLWERHAADALKAHDAQRVRLAADVATANQRVQEALALVTLEDRIRSEATDHEAFTLRMAPLKHTMCLVRVRGSTSGLLCWSQCQTQHEAVITGDSMHRRYFGVVGDARRMLPAGMTAMDREAWSHSFITMLECFCVKMGVMKLYVSFTAWWEKYYGREPDGVIIGYASSKDAIRETRLRISDGPFDRAFGLVPYATARTMYHVVW